tara:strand:+ start:177 stop:779 length:603 start_codon:yes stop_codon:yes gene_type:complete
MKIVYDNVIDEDSENIDKNMKGTNEASVSMVDVNSSSKSKEDRKANRNSWMEIYHNNTERRTNLKLLGENVAIDEWLDWRVKWGQRGIGCSLFIALISHICSGGALVVLRILTVVFASIALIFFGMLYYKNISLVIMKRLLKETNVVVILVLTICNWVIEIGRPMNSLSPIMGLIYVLGINAFVFIDAISKFRSCKRYGI